MLGLVCALDPLHDLVPVGGIERIESFLGFLVVFEGGAQIGGDARSIVHAGTIPRRFRAYPATGALTLLNARMLLAFRHGVKLPDDGSLAAALHAVGGHDPEVVGEALPERDASPR